jgi:acyl dehydratase
VTGRAQAICELPRRTNGSSFSFTDFASLRVGDQVTLEKRFTAATVEAFALLSGDFNPLHIDPEFARRTRFQRCIAHGMLSAAYISTLVGTRLPGAGAVWLDQRLEFPAPVLIDDDIEFLLRIEHKSEATRTVVIGVEARNQQGVLVVKGRGKVMVIEEVAE